MSIKVALIGAGSVVFSKNLTGDILGFPEFQDATFSSQVVDRGWWRGRPGSAAQELHGLDDRARPAGEASLRRATRSALPTRRAASS